MPQLDEMGIRILAAHLRSKLREGQAADSWFMDIVNRMTDKELVDKYIEHDRCRPFKIAGVSLR